MRIIPGVFAVSHGALAHPLPMVWFHKLTSQEHHDDANQNGIATYSMSSGIYMIRFLSRMGDARSELSSHEFSEGSWTPLVIIFADDRFRLDE